MQTSSHYDYIFTGAGAAALSLLVRLLESGKFTGKKILLIDNKPEVSNDRTWCFWEATPGYFDHLVHKRWDAISFRAEGFNQSWDISPYQYKMIRGIDFYNYCLGIVKTHDQVTTVHATVDDFSGKEGDTWVQCGDQKWFATYIFNSILFQRPPMQPKEFLLLQHFKGWVIETRQPVFDPGTAVFMDFRTSQQHGATFIYVMPLSTHRALIEYTLFSPDLLTNEGYESGIRDYLARFYPSVEYDIQHEEFGIIPMTNHRFPSHNGHIIHIGTAGGQTKASSGYTFHFIQQHSDALLNALINGRSLTALRYGSSRFKWYDSVFLNVLATGKLQGHEVFTRLFEKNKPQRIFRFLNNQSTFKEDLRIMNSLPVWPFFRAAIQQTL